MSVDISVNITEDVVDIIATPTVNIVNVTNSASIDPGLYDLSEFTNTSVNPFTRTNSFKTVEGVSIIGTGDIDITKASVGLGNVDNTSDLNKPISTATQTALNAKVTGNTAITGATKTKVTYDSKGLVTSGADATTADIADSINKRYVTDANLTVIGNTSGTNTGDQTLSGLGGVPTTRTLTINGTTQDLSADRTFTVSTGITIGTTAITSGTIGRVLFEGTGNVVQESANLFWDNTNGRLGIGTSSPAEKFEIVSGAIQLSNAQAIKSRYTGGASFSILQMFSDNNTYLDGANDVLIRVSAGATTAMILKNTGNVLINTTTDAGYKLDVNGTARVQTSLEVAGASGVTFGGGASVLSYSGAILNIGNSATWTDVRLFAGGVQKYSQTSTLTTIANTTINLATSTVQLAGVNALAYSGADVRIGSITAGFTSLSFYTSATEKMRIAATTGNVLINTTTDAGYKLDVNGTARVQGDLTLTSTFAVKMNNNNRWVGASQLYAGVQIYAAATGTDVIQMTAGGQVHISSAGGITTQASALLQADSTTKGFLPPRQTQAQRTAIASPAVGLIVYQTDLVEGLYIYKSTGWQFIV